MDPTQPVSQPSNLPDYPLREEVPQNVENPLAVMQPGERIICEIKRHPVGLLGIYAFTTLVLGACLAVAILVPVYVTVLTQQQKIGVILSAGLFMLITLIVAYIAVYVYQANRWIVTSDSLTQITQTGLFDRHSSQLSLANLEDVTADQEGIFQQLLGYGDLTVETAGADRNKFVFSWCPNPNEYARKIIAAHEEFIHQESSQMSMLNQPLATVQAYNQQAGVMNQPTPPSQPPSAGSQPTA